MACGCNGAVTNGGAKLIDRARNENKALVFSAVRMNTVYENSIMELVQKPETWFGATVGEVVGCLSHIIIDDVSHVCDAKVAVQCNDNSKAWKTIAIYGHLEGESNDTLIYCESIQNGDFKGTTLVEFPVTLDGAVDDFGLSEGGGGGGGDVPANMMTTDTEQMGLSGLKSWELQAYIGGASAENPDIYDLLNVSHAEIGNFSHDYVEGRPVSYPVQCSNTQQFYDGSGWVSGASSYAKLSPLGVLQLNSGDKLDGSHEFRHGESIEITPNSILYQNPDMEYGLSATWADIIQAATRPAPELPDIRAGQEYVQDDGEGNLMIFGQTIQPDSYIQSTGFRFTFDSSGYLESVSSVEGVATIGLVVRDENGNMVANGRISGFSVGSDTPLTFQSPIQLLQGYTITYQAIFSVI